MHCAQQAAGPFHLRPRSATTLLVVENDEDSREMLCAFLSWRGHDVIEATTGPDGLRRAIEDRPAVVMLDIALPKLDGISIAKRLRADAATRRIGLVATTGSTMDATGWRCFDAVLTKPFDLRGLERVIEDLLRAQHRLDASS